MSVINELVTKSSRLGSVHLKGLKIALPKQSECSPSQPSPKCANSKKKDKSAEKGIQRLCQRVNQMSAAYGSTANDPTLVPQPVLDNIQSAISQCLMTHPMCNEQVKPKQIAVDDVKEAIEKYIKLPKEGGQSADYANCDVSGEVKDNTYQICVSINFYTTQHVNCHSLSVNKVMGLAVDNSAVNIQIPDNSRNGLQQHMVTRL